MVEHSFYSGLLPDNTTFSIKSGISGMVKKVRISTAGNFALTDGTTEYWRIQISPIIDDSNLGSRVKFSAGVKIAIPADNVSLVCLDREMKWDTNFYLDKEDYIIFINQEDGTSAYQLILDVVPVSDKTRLFNGGEYHNQ